MLSEPYPPVMLACIERLAAEGKSVSDEIRAQYQRQTGRALPERLQTPNSVAHEVPVPASDKSELPTNNDSAPHKQTPPATNSPCPARPSPCVRVTRAPKKSHFARIDNALLQNPNLSYRARGLMSYVLSCPTTWNHSAERLAEATEEGEKAVVAALHELEAQGYSWIERIRTQHGRLENRRYFSESPNPEKRRSVEQSPTPEKGGSDGDTNRTAQNRGSVDRPFGEGGVYETTGVETTNQAPPTASPSVDVPPAHDKNAEANATRAKRQSEPDAQAEAIYAAYPRKVGRHVALRAIKKALKVVAAEKLLVIVQSYAAAVAQWPEADRKFIPHPATWFNQGRFEDNPAEWVRKPCGKAATGVAANTDWQRNPLNR